MKGFVFALLFILTAASVRAQTITISGTVKDKQGDELHLAFVQDKHDKYATYTDSAGNFALTIIPGAKFRVSCFGYRDTTIINSNNQTNYAIVLNEVVNVSGSNIHTANSRPINMAAFSDDLTLTPEGTLESQKPRATVINSRQGAGSVGGTLNLAPNTVDMAQGAIFPVFQQKEATVGSRYFFPDWTYGYVINAKDSVIQNPGFFFNYDKMGGGLLLSRDKKAAIEVDKENVKSFTLYDKTNMPYTFERVPDIDSRHYVQVLAAGSKYKIYKLTETKFNKANYASDGIMTTGKDYDEYENNDVYYIYIIQNNQLQKLSLKKKAIKVAFVTDADKLNKFMADHSDDTIDDMYLAGLGAYMNE